ncbi:efflux RND transporter periplasmic adaptor subunit [Spirosoma aerolatum]|uniref:efflux RND transporter periplasmic adaptor subunit n=1 Tax=Spirosoma aerolatum TaxID=1211326 RepID=UPI0009AC6D43|nr:efflux RND transporter periplasmic adaptor subunit [Spirosoma aerolatum]
MNTQHNLFSHTISFALFLAGASLAFSCQSGSTNTNEAQETKTDSTHSETTGPVQVTLTQAQYSMAEIQLGQPESRPMQTMLKVTGMLEVPAQNEVSVSVPVGGYIRKIQLEPGMQIRKGQPLVILENPEYVQLQQDYLDTKAKLGYADVEYARQQELSRDNVAALKVFQQTKANRQSLQAQLAGLGQRLSMLHINPATLTPEQLTRTITIPSPISGFVTNVPVNNGRFVNPADVIVQLTDISHMHLQLSVFEKDLSQIHIGQAVRFALGGDTSAQVSSFPHKGSIFLIGKSIAADRTVPVLVHPEGRSGDFIPGSYAAAQVSVRAQQLATVPESAVVNFGGKSYVYALEQRSKDSYVFRQIDVKTGIRERGYVAVTIPADLDPQKTPLAVKGAYNLLAKLNNSEEE